ncbi:hypothetical protein BDV35DRAFT_394817 [Aspergillus flavus]|uniref:Cyanovirin-N domain-containing protein n=1 Tax=Aspergillus flavus TaxID=5059 RepID=A0A5N6GUB9_ASPFL|nr:hypothetical protein BDV35DRAFT_394817 [Aspergillus flavus]
MHASHLALFVALSIGAMCIIEPPTGTGFSKTCNDLKITTDSGRISLEAACLDGKSKTRQKSTLDLSPCFEYSGNNLFQAKMNGRFQEYFDVRNIGLECNIDQFERM